MSDSDSIMPEKLGRYEIVGIIGRGAMGVVYEGRDPNINRRVAIKTARRDVMESSGRADEMMERFLREARAAGGINHPNIITIYDADEQDGLAYMAMEYIEGTDLHKQIQSKKRFDVKDIIERGAVICEALAHAHNKGIVHRDVKPSNIMVLEDGTLRIADFGIAHVSDSNLTQEGAMIGTPHYMSPEQFMGQKVDGRSDLFSVGIILYEMLTGEKPFPGEAVSTVMHSVIKTNPIDPKELNLSVNPVLSQVVMKSLAKSPADRYQDGTEMAAALRECLKDKPDPAITKVGVAAAAVANDATVAMHNEKTMVVDQSAAEPPAEEPKDLLGADTQLGGPQPGAGRAERGKGVQAPSEQADVSTKKKWPLAAGIAVVAIVIIGAAVASIGGEPAITHKIPIDVKLANTVEQWENQTGDLAAEFHITVTEPDDPDKIIHEKDYSETEIIEFKTSLDAVTVFVSVDGYEPTDFGVNLTGGRVDLRSVLLTTADVNRQMRNATPDASES